MVKFAQDVEQCRKVAFAKYANSFFSNLSTQILNARVRYMSTASALDMRSWSTIDEDAEDPCGHCDNCLRPQETIDRRDVTLPAWQILMLAEEARRRNISVTLMDLAKIARGNKSQKISATMDELAGGPVRLSPAVGH